jgi:hypothetical protein
MLFRRAVVLAVCLYVTADYCDPSIRGVFRFATDSFFIESIRSAPVPDASLPSSTSPLGRRDTITLSQRSLLTTRVKVQRGERLVHPPRAQISAAPLATSGASEDH